MSSNVDTILHKLCENRKWERVLNRLNSHPTEAKVRDVNGDCCLHYLADLKAPLPVIIAMIQANPEAAVEQDCYNHTPIRWATQREHTGGAWKVIDVLLTSWPEHVEKLKLASEVYEGGQLLLHIAAEKGAPIDIVNKLLDIYPGAAEVKVSLRRGRWTDQRPCVSEQACCNKTFTFTSPPLFQSRRTARA